MTNNQEQPNIQNEILERIRSGQLRMKPRLFFALKVVLLLAISALVLLISILLASFIFFDIRFNGHTSLLGFGSRGALLFLWVFPWSLALLDIALIVLLGWLLRHFKFAYHRALLYFFFAFVGMAGAVGLLFDRETGFHDDRFEEAEQGELLLPLESLYEGIHIRAPEELGLYRGFVVSIADATFVITYDDRDNDEDDHTWNILPPDDFEMEELKIGDRVYIAGEQDGDEIRAYGVEILEP